MKIALISQPYDGVFPPNQSSIGLINYNTAIEMAQYHPVTLFSKKKPGLELAEDLPFAPVFVSAKADDTLQHLATCYPRWSRRFGISTLADSHYFYARSVLRELDPLNPDIIHVMNYWSWCRHFRSRVRQQRRIVLEMQCEWLSQIDTKQILNALEATDAVIAVSDHIARLFRASFPAYRGPVVTAYNGVNVEIFQPDPKRDSDSDDFSVLFVGRVSPEKGIHTLIEAFAQIASKNDHVKLIIAGPRDTLREDFIVGISADPLVQALNRFYNSSVSSDYQCYLDELVSRLGLSSKVSFLGRIPHKELVHRYQSSSVVVNPSLSESFGISIVEGMACGIPVVGTKVGGMLETIVDGKTGLLVEPEQPDLLAEAIISLLKDQETRRRMGVNGRIRAIEHFSWRARVDRLLSAYQMVLGQGRV